MTLPRIRIVAFNDVYELANLPKLQTFLSKLSPSPHAVTLSGDFLSPSTLSALDGGKGMVATLRAVGVTHACLGNHEADLKLPVLEKRLMQLSKSATIINSNIRSKDEMSAFLSRLPKYSILESSCQRVRIGLLGLLSDEPSVLRKSTFRGSPIDNVIATFQQLHQELVIQNRTVDMLLPLTHQSLARDEELARCIRKVQPHGHSLILGGHEHVPHDVTISDDNKDGNNNNNNSLVRIIKSGTECEAVTVVDLTFDFGANDDRPYLAEIVCELVDLSVYAASRPVQKIVESHAQLFRALQNEDLVHADSYLPPGVVLSTKQTRYKQTTGGGILCRAIKEELEVDVCLINGATIKGDADYRKACMSYAELQKELPFPTKMVIVPMKRWELHEAIHYSRTQPPPANNDEPERKGFLQVDVEFDRLGFHTGGQDDDLMVALPRNLLKGFCDIRPLVQLGQRLHDKGQFPADDDFIPAMNLIVRYFCKERWYELVRHHYSFADLDTDHKGYLSRDDVKRLLRQAVGHEPAEFVVDDMIAAIDTDENGTIDPGEFSHLLAEMEREHGLIRFD